MKKTLSVLLSVLLLSLVTVPSFAAPATLNKENPVGSVKILPARANRMSMSLQFLPIPKYRGKLLLTR